MRMTTLGAFLLSGALLLGIFATTPHAMAKKWTVTDRVEKLSGEIDEGRAANELTTKQVDTLKGMVASLKERMEKMKAKNGGKLSIPDTKKLHDDITNLSVKILKDRLNNVYSD